MLVLRPRQPQARDVGLATHTAVARTTDHLARNVHTFPKLREGPVTVNNSDASLYRYFASFFWMHGPGQRIHTPANRGTSIPANLLQGFSSACDIYIWSGWSLPAWHGQG